MTKQNELVVIETANVPALFEKDGCNPIIEGLKKEAAKFEGDISTAKGRKEIASFARKFSTSKVYLDKLGKALSDEYRAKIAPIQAERNKIEVCCDELRDKIRKPLTDWEDAEKERVKRHEDAIQFINNHLEVEFEDSVHVAKLLEMVNGVVVDEAFEEFELAARKEKEKVVEQLEAKFIVLQDAEKEKAEADRLEEERLAKEQKEREKKIAKEAAEKATREAKAKTKEKEAKAKQAVIDAKAATEKAKREKKEAKDLAEKEKKAAAEQAEKDREAAVEAEKQRQADQIKADKEAEEKRQANKKHRNKIIKEVNEDFMKWTKSDVEKSLVDAIVDGDIRHLKVEF